MVLLARILTRLVGVLLFVVLAAAGLAAAVFCIQGGHGTLSLPGLASDLHLTVARANVGRFLHRLQAPGPPAVVSALCGLGAVVLGVVLLIGSLVMTRERLLVLARGENGVIAVRRRALAQAAAALAEQPRMVLDAKARARPWRRRTGGWLRVRVRGGEAQGPTDGDVIPAVRGALAPLTDSLPLRVRVSAKMRQAARVR